MIVDSEHVDRGESGEIGNAAGGIDRKEGMLGAESVGEEPADQLPVPFPLLLAGARGLGIQKPRDAESDEADCGDPQGGPERSWT